MFEHILETGRKGNRISGARESSTEKAEWDHRWRESWASRVGLLVSKKNLLTNI